MTTGGRCEKHKRQERKEIDDRRGSAKQRGYDSRWAKARKQYLRQHPFCVMCQADGRGIAAEVVDHVKPHKGDDGLFWDVSNWQPLCRAHHNSKTAKQDGRWG